MEGGGFNLRKRWRWDKGWKGLNEVVGEVEASLCTQEGLWWKRYVRDYVIFSFVSVCMCAYVYYISICRAWWWSLYMRSIIINPSLLSSQSGLYETVLQARSHCTAPFTCPCLQPHGTHCWQKAMKTLCKPHVPARLHLHASFFLK